MLNKSLAVGIVFLFIVSSTIPMVLGNDIESEIQTQATALSDGPMDSPWSMKCHDLHHTGLSPYSTANVTGLEKWRFRADDWVNAGIIIGDDGTIYFGDFDRYIYALNLNGTEKWRYGPTGGWIGAAPALADDGTIYITSWDCNLYVLNSSNGAKKWKFNAGGVITSSPAIALDRTIYFGVMGPGDNKGRVYAVNPNGTEKWHYDTEYWITSDPAVADDGTIYIGSGDTYFYAIYPNGTLKWRYKTGDYVKGPASIAEDGTIYVGSFDGYLYALYPDNGTIKWKCKVGVGTETNPSIASDGTIYVGGLKLYAVYPNGTIKWSYDPGELRRIEQSSPAISADGTIYVGTNIGDAAGGDIIAVNHDGTEKWRKKIAYEWVDSSPCIGEDGTVYIGSATDWGGYIHAFGPVESNSPPEIPTISGETNGKPREDYWYSITAVDHDRNPISFYIDWGDGDEGWTSERASGEKCYYEHSWLIRDRYTIRVKTKDVMGEESDWATLEVSMSKNKIINPFERFLENHPYLFPILKHLLGLY